MCGGNDIQVDSSQGQVVQIFMPAWVALFAKVLFGDAILADSDTFGVLPDEALLTLNGKTVILVVFTDAPNPTRIRWTGKGKIHMILVWL